jgi:hypothetical protein
MTIPRDEWLARRASHSLGRTLRLLERWKFRGPGVYFNRPERVTIIKTAVIKGRNYRKHLVRSTKQSKKQWGVIK